MPFTAGSASLPGLRASGRIRLARQNVREFTTSFKSTHTKLLSSSIQTTSYIASNFAGTATTTLSTASGASRLIRLNLTTIRTSLRVQRRKISSTASKSDPKPRATTTTTTTSNISSASPQAIPVAGDAPVIPIWQRLGPFTWAIRAFGRSQRKRPYVTQFISTLVIYFLGDISAQRIRISGDTDIGREAGYEPERTAKALVIGAGGSIPTYLWFVHLATHYNYASFHLSLLVKVLVNQLCYTPVFNSYFFGMQAVLGFVPFLNPTTAGCGSFSSEPHQRRISDLLTSESWRHVGQHIAKTVPLSFVNSCKLWPAVTYANFWIVPMEFRAITSGVVAVGWQTYLSFLNRRAENEEEEQRLEGGEAEEVPINFKAVSAAAEALTNVNSDAGKK